MKHIPILIGISALLSVNPIHAERAAMLSPDSTFVADALSANSPDGVDGVSRYLIWGKKDTFIVGVGGFGMATVGEDFGNADADANSFSVSQLTPGAPEGAKAFNISAAQTTLYLNFVAFPGSANQIGVFVMGNMLGDNYAPSLEEAYVSYRGIRAGYNYTVFSDNGTMPSTIDHQGPNSSTAIQLPQLSYSLPFGKNRQWEAQAGVSIPQTSFTCAYATESCRGRIPDFAAALKYCWAEGGGSVKAAAIVRSLSYRNTAESRFIDKAAWGVMVTGMTPIAGPFSFCWNGVYGNGVASYIQDLSDMGLDMTPGADGKGLRLSTSWGAYGGISCALSEKVVMTGFYSHVRNYAKRFTGTEQEWGNLYSYGQYAGGNLMWQVSPILSTGVEYLYGRRVDNNGAQNHCSRVQAMLKVDF